MRFLACLYDLNMVDSPFRVGLVWFVGLCFWFAAMASTVSWSSLPGCTQDLTVCLLSSSTQLRTLWTRWVISQHVYQVHPLGCGHYEPGEWSHSMFTKFIHSVADTMNQVSDLTACSPSSSILWWTPWTRWAIKVSLPIRWLKRQL